MKNLMSYKSKTQEKNIAWFLPRPKPDRYRGGMPLYCERWLIDLAREILGLSRTPNILNLFCGMNNYGLRVDIKPEVKPDICCDAHEFTKHFSGRISPKAYDTPEAVGKFDIILADPPYSDEESKKLYGTPKLNYKKWTAECDKVLKKGGLLIVHHKFIVPNPNPEKYEVVKRVFIGNRTWHLPRVAIFFKKK